MGKLITHKEQFFSSTDNTLSNNVTHYMPEFNPDIETSAKIKVIGVGGSGGSAVNRMIQAKIRGVEFMVMNTDVQALHVSMANKKIQLGKTISRGLGAGMDPEIGAKAAEESSDEIREAVKGANMVFITSGLGGGTGSGAAPKVAEISRELGILTVAVVTRPFQFEGYQRKMIADAAHARLSEQVDTIITIPNDRILDIIDRKTSIIDAFEIVDDVLRQGVQGISDIISIPGLINVDFADVSSIMKDRGSALMGIGKGTGENRVVDAAKSAIASPLLETSIDGAKGILFTVTGGVNLSMHEISEAAKVINDAADKQAKIIFGAILDETMKDEVKFTVIATGFDDRPVAPQRSVIAGGAYVPDQPIEKVNFQRSVPQAQQPVSHFAEIKYSDNVEPVKERVYAEPPQQPVSLPQQPVIEPQKDARPAQHQPHIQPPTYAPVAKELPKPQAPARVPAEKEKADDDDIADIPAWFRKKMM